MKRDSRSTLVSSSAESNLLLFPPEMLTPSETSSASDRHPPHPCNLSQASAVSLEQVRAAWKQIVRRLGRGHRVLEALLTAGQPVQVSDRRLVIGFSAQRLFHEELLNLPE